MLVQDKVALVTGAAQGIGRAIALALAQAGAHVMVADVNGTGAAAVAEEITAMGRRAATFTADVSDRAQVWAMADATVAELGEIDILVNNAARLFPHDGPFHTMPAESWLGGIDVNLNGVAWCCQAALGHMVRQGRGGKIINISSVHSIVALNTTTPYVVAKGAINMLTRALAAEYAPHKINVNAVAPGAIATPTIGQHTAETIRAYQRRIPLGERGTPADIAGAALFLASDLARYMTGQVLYVDGGYIIDGTLTDLKPPAGDPIR